MPSKCSSVDLPAPEGPMMETNSPSLISALMRRSTNVLVGPCSKYFSTFRRVRIGELIVYVSIVTHWRGYVPLLTRGATSGRQAGRQAGRRYARARPWVHRKRYPDARQHAHGKRYADAEQYRDARTGKCSGPKRERGDRPGSFISQGHHGVNRCCATGWDICS